MSSDRDALFIAVIDGYATADQVAEVNRLLSEDPEARLHYVQYTNVHGALLTEESLGAQLQLPQNFSAELAADSKPFLSFTGRHWLLATAAAVLIGLFIVSQSQPDPPADEVAALPVSENDPAGIVHAAWGAEWSNDMPMLRAGDTLPVGRQLDLRFGVVHLQIDSVDVYLQAPARFKIRTDGSVDLNTGMLVAHVHDAKKGFTVHLPTADVVDLGTVFGIHATAGGDDQVHVFSGRVDVVETTGTSIIASLEAGEGVRLEESGAAQPIRANAGQFQSILPTDAIEETAETLSTTDEIVGRQIGEWDPGTLTDSPRTLTWDVSDYVVNGHVCDLLFQRTGGAPLQVSRVELLRDGAVVSSDSHRLTASVGGQRYRVWTTVAPGSRYELRATLSHRSGRKSKGRVWLEQIPTPSGTLVTGELAPGENLALGKPVTAAATRYGAPSKVTDGDTGNDGIWASREYPQSCRVDLKNLYSVDRVRLYLWRDGSSHYRYVVSVSADAKTWTRVVDMSRNTLPSHISGDRHVFPAVTARYVKVDMLYNSNAPTVSVAELEIFEEK
jgi:hypothetical protein